LLNAQNIGYIIPVPVIKRFLNEYEKSKKIVFCDPGFTQEKMENPALRKYYKIQDHQTGVLITKVAPLSSFASLLKVGDVLLTFDGTPIADDGTISFRDDERISWSHLVDLKYMGDSCKISFLRDGVEMELQGTIEPNPLLVPRLHGFDIFPDYYIVGGLVFYASFCSFYFKLVQQMV